MTNALLEVTDRDFDRDVLERSHTMPVLVDFWAPWCGPCRVLGPVLASLAPSVADRVAIVKLNTEDNPATAREYAISSIPAVKLFRGGEVVAEFVGALPEVRVRAFIDQHCPSEFDALAVAAASAWTAGESEAARRDVQKVLTALPDHPRASLVAARIALADGDPTTALAHAGKVPPRSDGWDDAQTLIQLARLVESAAGRVDDHAAAFAASPTDIGARYRLAVALAGAGRYEESLDHFLGVVEQDRRWDNEAGRRAMLVVFAAIGPQHPLSSAYRRKLAVLL